MTPSNPRRVLVTGAGGFVGRTLTAQLVAAGYDVTGIGRGPRPPKTLPQIEWRTVDLLDPASVKHLPRSWWAVVHLANNSIPQSFAGTRDVLGSVGMTVEVLEQLEPCRFLFVSSCHVYAAATGALSESSATHPAGRYGLAKLLGEQAALAYADRLDIRIARSFNHLGRGMNPTLAIPSLVRRVVRERRFAGPLRMQGRNSTRDFIDVEDVASAYLSLIQQDAPKERVFNVSTGVARTIGEIAEAVLALAGCIRNVEFEQAKLSSDDTSSLVGDSSRLQQLTGWHPKRSLHESLGTMLGEFSIETAGDDAPPPTG